MLLSNHMTPNPLACCNLPSVCSLSLILRRVQSRSVRAPRNSSSSISPTPIHQNPRRRWKYRQSPSRQSPPAPQPSLISTTIPPSTNTFVRRAGNCRIGIPRLHPICLTKLPLLLPLPPHKVAPSLREPPKSYPQRPRRRDGAT